MSEANMKIINEIKACLYRIKFAKTFVFVYIMILLSLVSLYCLPIISEDRSTILESFCGEYSIFPLLLIMVITVFVTFLICVGDYQSMVSATTGNEEQEKTMLLTVMSGKRRITIFVARVLLSILVSYVLAIGVILVPIYLTGILFPIGNEIAMTVLWQRTALMIFPVMRLSCEAAMFFFVMIGIRLLKELSLMLAMSIPAAGLMVHGIPNFFTHVLSMHSMKTLFSFVEYETYTFKLDRIFVYTTHLTASNLCGTILFGLLASAFSFLIGYQFCKTADL